MSHSILIQYGLLKTLLQPECALAKIFLDRMGYATAAFQSVVISNMALRASLTSYYRTKIRLMEIMTNLIIFVISHCVFTISTRALCPAK